MIRLRRLLVLVLVLELAVGGLLVGRRALDPHPPLPDLSHQDSWTRADVEGLRQKAVHGGVGDWLALAQAYLGTGDYVEAEQCYRVAVDLSPDDQQAVYGLGFTLERLGRLEAAIETLQRASQLSSDDLSLTCWYQIGRCWLRLENTAAAEAAFRKSHSYLPPAAAQLAKLLIREGRAQEALPIIEKGLQQFPNGLEFVQLRLRAAAALGQDAPLCEYRDRERRAQAVLAPGYGTVLLTLYRSGLGLDRQLARCGGLLSTGSVDQQAACLDDALRSIRSELRYEHILVFVTAVELALARGRHEEAQSLLSELESLEFETPKTVDLTGDVAWALGDAAAARVAWERAARLQALPHVHRKLGIILEEQGDTVGATRHLALSQVALGRLAFQQNELDTARAAFAAATEHAPDMARSWYYLGEIDRIHDRVEQARAAFEHCLQIDPDYEPARVSLKRLRVAE